MTPFILWALSLLGWTDQVLGGKPPHARPVKLLLDYWLAVSFLNSSDCILVAASGMIEEHRVPRKDVSNPRCAIGSGERTMITLLQRGASSLVTSPVTADGDPIAACVAHYCTRINIDLPNEYQMSTDGAHSPRCPIDVSSWIQH